MNELLGFKYDNIMTINGRVQHVDDTVPDVLATLVQENSSPILRRMGDLVQKEMHISPFQLPTRPVILIAKMAMLQNIGNVLTFDAVQSSELVFDQDKSINEPYFEYWLALNAIGPFQPQVVRRGGEIEEQGIWLGVTIRDQLYKGRHRL